MLRCRVRTYRGFASQLSPPEFGGSTSSSSSSSLLQLVAWYCEVDAMRRPGARALLASADRCKLRGA